MMRAAFFDLGDTLGTPVLSAPPIHLIGFEVFEVTVPVLDDLGGPDGLRLGVISNTGNDDGATVDAVLERAGIRDFFEPALRIYSRDVGLRKDSPEIFLLAAARAGVAPHECLFVGENPAERGFAAQAGFLVAARPQDARAVIATQPDVDDCAHGEATKPDSQATGDEA
jgi:FMN phosphatase YigB (HAD superfamily)